MSMATATILTVAGMGAMGAGQVYSSKKASSAEKNRAAAGAEANRSALDFERDQDRLDREERARIDAENQRRYDEYAREERRRDDLDRQTDSMRYGESLSRSRALDAFEREKYAARRGDMAPYRASGVQALQRLGQVANLSIRPTTPPEKPAAKPMADLAQGL